MNKNRAAESAIVVARDKYDMQTLWGKPAVTAAIGTVAAKMTVLPEQYVEILGRRVPVWAATFGALYGASMAAELANEYLLPYVSRDERFDSAKGLVGPASCGAASLALWQVGNADILPEKGFWTLFGLGAASEVAGSYAWERVIQPLLA